MAGMGYLLLRERMEKDTLWALTLDKVAAATEADARVEAYEAYRRLSPKGKHQREAMIAISEIRQQQIAEERFYTEFRIHISQFYPDKRYEEILVYCQQYRSQFPNGKYRQEVAREAAKCEDLLKPQRPSVQNSRVIQNVRTALEWYVGPDQDMNWHEAKSFVENLAVEGGGWRLPSPKELQSLTQNETGNHGLGPEFSTTGGAVWSTETQKMGEVLYAWCLDFNVGSGSWDKCSEANDRRVFAVRSRK
jgi:hypothetical protein